MADSTEPRLQLRRAWLSHGPQTAAPGHLLEAPREEGAAGKRTHSLAHESRPKTPSSFAVELARAGARASALLPTPRAARQGLSSLPAAEHPGEGAGSDNGDTGVRVPESEHLHTSRLHQLLTNGAKVTHPKDSTNVTKTSSS